jgi:hypothetical protein
MRKLLSLLSLVSLFSCGGSQKIFERKLQDGSSVIVKKGVFSGINFLYAEKKAQKSILYKLYYECECGFDNKIALRKDYTNKNGDLSFWTAVTDTVSSPKFFTDTLTTNRLYSPIEFMPITEEEISLLEEGLIKIDKPCCSNPNKPITKIIGYVRQKLH